MAEQLRSDLWVDYFKAIASGDEAPSVTVEVVRDQPGARRYCRRRLRNIGYDPKEDVLQLVVGAGSGGEELLLRHFICDPRTITVDGQAPLGPTAILVQDAAGIRTRIRFFDDGPPRPGTELVGFSGAARWPRQPSRHVIAEYCG